MANPGKTDYALGIKYFPKLVSIAHKVKSNIQNYPSTLSLNERENVWLKKDMIKKKGGGDHTGCLSVKKYISVKSVQNKAQRCI